MDRHLNIIGTSPTDNQIQKVWKERTKVEYLRPPQLQALADAIGLWHLTGGNSHGTLCLGQGDHEPGEPFRPGDFDSFIEMFFKTGLFYVSNGIVVLAVAINLVDCRLVWYGKNLVGG
jgi:hypothetical protein